MSNSKNQSLHFCGCCKKELPLDQFYFLASKQRLDNYCIECRKDITRNHLHNRKLREGEKENETAPTRCDLTKVEDPEVRHTLIMQALGVIARMAEAKKKKYWEEEDRKFS